MAGEPTPVTQPNKTIWVTALSRVQTDWTCSRKRFWSYHYAGRGIQPKGSHVELMLGSTLHDGLAAIATQWKASHKADIDAIATTCAASIKDALSHVSDKGDVYPTEQASLVEGLLRGFYRHVWANLISQFPNIISIEQEVTYPLGEAGFIFSARPDIVMSDDDGNWIVIDYKSTSTKSEEWINQWNTAVQLHSLVKAVGHTLGTEPTQVMVQGLYKGYNSYGKQGSIFCYGYHRQGTPPFSYPEFSYDYKGGFKRYPVWEMEGGLKAWLDNMPDNVMADQFPCTAPIYVNNNLVERFFQQRLLREFEIKQATDMLDTPGIPPDMKQQFMDGFFPQRFESCTPSYGKGCQYKQLCFGGVDNPLDLGWELREPFLEAEKQLLAEKDLKNAQL